LSDEDGEVCRAYDACDDLTSSQARRETYIIGPDGRLLQHYPDVKPQEQAETALAFLAASHKPSAQERKPSARPDGQRNGRVGAFERHRAKDVMMKEQEHEIGDTRPSEASTSHESVGGKHAVNAAGQPAPASDVAVSPSATPVSEGPQPEPIQAVTRRKVEPSQNEGGPSLVFALGTLGYTFASETRRDSLMQHIGDEDLLDYLEDNPSEAASLIWTLNLDGTPIYAVQPQGPFANRTYAQLRQFLREQIEEGVERVSIPGFIIGQVALMSGQRVPVIRPELRCMYSWKTSALLEALYGESPSEGAEQAEYGEQTEGVTNFLQRVYGELRNLGVTSQQRALNYAGANIANTANIFQAALEKELELYGIEAVPSPICRPGADCWEVRLSFFDPENVLRAKRVYGFTVDVSDVCPVMTGQVRAWSMP
jgi:cyanobactin maturation PatA/PatG family protease